MQRCDICIGSGKVMGGGMIYKSCEKCLGAGKLSLKKDCEHFDIEMVKGNVIYNNALDKIKALDASMSDEQAEKLLDEELTKIEPVKIKKVRGKNGKGKRR